MKLSDERGLDKTAEKWTTLMKRNNAVVIIVKEVSGWKSECRPRILTELKLTENWEKKNPRLL